MCDALRKTLEVNILNLIFNKLSIRYQLSYVHFPLSKYHQICDLRNFVGVFHACEKWISYLHLYSGLILSQVGRKSGYRALVGLKCVH